MCLEEIIEKIPKTIVVKEKEYSLTIKYNKYAKYWDVYYGNTPYEYYECVCPDLKDGLTELYNNLIRYKVIKQ